MQKAFSELCIKSWDKSEGIIRGIATTPTTDKMGDIVEPMGAQFTLPLPLHHEHDRKDVVGEVFEATPTPDGIEFAARIAKDASDQIAEVWKRVDAGLIKYVSVGMSFRSDDVEVLKQGLRFKKWVWHELSLTTIPANQEAVITATKAVPPSIHTKGNTMTIAEQIAAFELKKSVALAGMDTLITKGVALVGDDQTAYAAHEAEVTQIDEHLARLKSAEQRQAAAAKPVQGSNITVTSNMPKGVAFIAASKALIQAKGNPHYAADLAKSLYRDDPRIEQFILQKAAVGAATTTSHAALTTPGALVGEFIDLLNNAHILGRLQGFRRVPHGVKIPRLATGATAYWVGQAKPIPVTTNAVDDLDISRFKIGAITPVANELMALGSPSIDAMLRDNIIEAIAQKVDAAFTLSTNAGDAVTPAAITYGLIPVASSGVGPQHVRADAKKALDKFAVANAGTNGAAWVMHSVTASALTFMRTAMGGPAFPGMTIEGGTFLGLPALVSNSMPGDGTAGYDMILIKASEIFRPDAPGIEIATSTEASYEALNASLVQSGAAGTGASLVSAFQNDETLIRVISYDGWYPRRTPCAVRVSACKYDESVIETISSVVVTP